MLRRNISPPSSGLRSKSNKKSAWNKLCLVPASCWFLVWLILWPWLWTPYIPPKRQSTFTGLRSAISQRIQHFITTAVRTSNLINYSVFIICLLCGVEHQNETGPVLFLNTLRYFLGAFVPLTCSTIGRYIKSTYSSHILYLFSFCWLFRHDIQNMSEI
jgi:hypothetical protein